MSAEQSQTQVIATHELGRVRSLSLTWVTPVAVAAFWMFLIWGVHCNSPRTLISFHGLLHAGIAEEFLKSSGTTLPPENPFFAGHPVAYYWFFHFISAQLTRATGLNIFYSMELLIVLSTALLSFTAVFLGRKLYQSTLAGVLIGYLILAGTNPLGWVHLIYTVVRSGPAVLKDSPDHLWGVVHPIYSLIRYADIGGIYGPLLNFFLNITSRPVALAGLLLAVFCLEWQLRSRRPWASVTLAFAFALTTAFNPIFGIAVGGVLLFSLVGFYLLNRVLFKPTELDLRLRTIFSAGLSILAGIAIPLPTYYHLLLGHSANHPEIALFSLDGLRHVVAVVMSIFILSMLALIGIFRAKQERRMLLLVLTTSACLLFAVDMIITLPAGNQSNFFHAAVVLLAVPAAGSISRIHSNRRRSKVHSWLVAGIFLVFLPTTALLVSSYLNRPAIAVSFDSAIPQRLPENSELSQLYKWARTETDPKAVFILDPREPEVICGNTVEFPAMTNRAIFTERRNHYISDVYPDSKLRYDMTIRLVSGESLSQIDREYLTQLRRPIYLVVEKPTSATGRMQSVYGQPVFQSGSIEVFSIIR
ncbi:MAG: hypothetical protein C5B44_05355 [Acidobacteria bacterium]|nr:MAG: hypothetical protein C5B44_05355 [Acidobacteriota bacterium]